MKVCSKLASCYIEQASNGVKKEILFLIIGLIGSSLAAISLSGVLADTFDDDSGKFNILINSADGEIISAGFSDFSGQLKDGLEQIKGLGSEIPVAITTDYYYNKATGKIVKRDTPVKPKYQKEQEEKEEAEKTKLKEDYLKLKTPEDKADFIAKYLKIID